MCLCMACGIVRNSFYRAASTLRHGRGGGESRGASRTNTLLNGAKSPQLNTLPVVVQPTFLCRDYLPLTRSGSVVGAGDAYHPHGG